MANHKNLIALRFRPFSHQSSIRCIIPYSNLVAQVSPAQLKIFDYGYREPNLVAEFILQGVGPLADFTVIQDLEKGCVIVRGFSPKGYLHYSIQANKDTWGWCVHVFKGPLDARWVLRSCHQEIQEEQHKALQEGAYWEFQQYKTIRFANSTIQTSAQIVSFHTKERLSLGCHKQQEWQAIWRRQSPNEFLPIVHALGQVLPKSDKEHSMDYSSGSILASLAACIKERNRVEIGKVIKHYFHSAFEEMFVPQLRGNAYLGYQQPCISEEQLQSPIEYITQIVPWVRKLFLLETVQSIEVLPCLPVEFHSGRMVNVATLQGYVLHFEWTKKQIRRVFIETPSNCHFCQWIFPKEIQRFRIRDVKGKYATQVLANDTIDLRPNTTYLFDKFEK